MVTLVKEEMRLPIYEKLPHTKVAIFAALWEKHAGKSSGRFKIAKKQEISWVEDSTIQDKIT